MLEQFDNNTNKLELKGKYGSNMTFQFTNLLCFCVGRKYLSTNNFHEGEDNAITDTPGRNNVIIDQASRKA